MKKRIVLCFALLSIAVSMRAETTRRKYLVATERPFREETLSKGNYVRFAGVDGMQIFTELGSRNSTRLPDYQRLDFRASRTAGAFSFFVELFNLLGREHVTRLNTFEFRQDANGAVTASPVTESVIGILPSFGVTWRF